MRLLALLTALLTLAFPQLACASIAGSFSSGVSTAFTPVAGVPFAVTIGQTATPSAASSGTFSLWRSFDGGATYAPVAPPPAVTQLGPVTFAAPISFNVTEPVSGATYVLLYVHATGTVPYRFDQ
jgi:hypothetical protein